ncbi:hypothetical protein BB559_004165, partial [Furculomyces boomerangus]
HDKEQVADDYTAEIDSGYINSSPVISQNEVCKPLTNTSNIDEHSDSSDSNPEYVLPLKKSNINLKKKPIPSPQQISFSDLMLKFSENSGFSRINTDLTKTISKIILKAMNELSPNEILAKEMLEGDFCYMERLSTIMCVNASGTEKLPLWIVGAGVDVLSSFRSQIDITSTIESHKVKNATNGSGTSVPSEKKKGDGFFGSYDEDYDYYNSGLRKNKKAFSRSSGGSRNKNKSTTVLGDLKDTKNDQDIQNDDNEQDQPEEFENSFYLRYNCFSSVSFTMFIEWMQWFDSIMSGREVSLILKDAPDIPYLDYPNLKNVKLLYAPPCTPALPTDSDLIYRTKLSYRQRYYDYLLSRSGVSISCDDVGCKQQFFNLYNKITPSLISVIDAAHMLSDAWILGSSPTYISYLFKNFELSTLKNLKLKSPALKNKITSISTEIESCKLGCDDHLWIHLENSINTLLMFFSKKQMNDTEIISKKGSEFFKEYEIEKYSQIKPN